MPSYIKYCLLIIFLSSFKVQSQELPKKLLKGLKKSPTVKKVFENKEKYNLQLLLTTIDRNSQNTPIFKSYYFGVDTSNYFYPASTVKFPVALCALEKLNEIGIEANSPLKIYPSYTGAVEVAPDSSQKETIENYIKRILLVSDNESFNRLYDFLGPKEIADKLGAKGFRKTDIRHRLAISLDENANRTRSALSFGHKEKVAQAPAFTRYEPLLISEWISDYSQDARVDELAKKSANKILLGQKYLNENDEIISSPFDFSLKNEFSLYDQHRLLKNFIFETDKPLFNLRDKDRQLVLDYMSRLPHEAEFDEYHSPNFYPSYVKYIQFGDSKEPIPPNIKIYNKIGGAYGFLTENAYLVDSKNKIEYLITVSVLVNENQTFNDNHYEYDTIAYPFMGELGRGIYNYLSK